MSFQIETCTDPQILEIVSQLKALCAIDSPSGYTREATEYVMEQLRSLGYDPQYTVKGGVLVELGGPAGGEGLLLSCHVDTLGAMVTRIGESGRLSFCSVGGLSPNNIEAENCQILTRDGRRYSGTFQLKNASVHVNEEFAAKKRTFDTMEVVVDEKAYTAQEIRDLGIQVGDYIFVDPRTTVTSSGYLKSRFLDDKLSVAILLAYARHLKEDAVSLKRRVYLHVTVFEEVGHGGAASIPADVTEFLCVDMGCVGDGLTCREDQVSICAQDSTGPYNYEMVSALIAAAKRRGVDYAVDVYPFYGSDADMALRAGNDVRHALIGAGVYASHGYERSHVDGAKNTLRLIEAFLED